jgi:hypothetical protein
MTEFWHPTGHPRHDPALASPPRPPTMDLSQPDRTTTDRGGPRRPHSPGHRRTGLPPTTRRSRLRPVPNHRPALHQTSIVLTTNRGAASWGEILGNTTVAAAMLDRLLHRSAGLNLDSDSLPPTRPPRPHRHPPARHHRKPDDPYPDHRHRVRNFGEQLWPRSTSAIIFASEQQLCAQCAPPFWPYPAPALRPSYCPVTMA